MQKLCAGGSIYACGSPSQSVSITSPISGRTLSLSPRSQRHIIQTWESIPDKQLLGQTIFTEIFMRKPALKRLWGLETIAAPDLPTNKLFLRHSSSFTIFLDICVRSLISTEPQNLVSLARNIGKKHVDFKQVSFDAEYWLLFKGALIDTVCLYNNSPHTKGAWNVLIMFIIMEMKDAYYSETQRKHSTGGLSVPPKCAIDKDVSKDNLFQDLEEQLEMCMRRNEDEYIMDGSPT